MAISHAAAKRADRWPSGPVHQTRAAEVLVLPIHKETAISRRVDTAVRARVKYRMVSFSTLSLGGSFSSAAAAWLASPDTKAS